MDHTTPTDKQNITNIFNNNYKSHYRFPTYLNDHFYLFIQNMFLYIINRKYSRNYEELIGIILLNEFSNDY